MQYHDDEDPEGQAWGGWDPEMGEGNPALLEPSAEDVELSE